MSVKQVDKSITTTVNGTERQASVAAGLLLVDFLRDELGLTGTKVGCETGQCGACTVLLDGVSVKSCAVLAVQADGSRVTTIEGLGENGSLTPLQESFREQHGIQCGFCTSGMVLAMTDLLNRNAQPTETEIREWMEGVMCRCGVYQNVIQAVQSAAAKAGERGG